jgi:xanthine dehydrogenase accessory factor
MSEIDDVHRGGPAAAAAGEPFGLATVVSVRGSSYRRPGARLLVPRDSAPVGLISGGCLEDEAARLARRAIDDEIPLLVTIDHSSRGRRAVGLRAGVSGRDRAPRRASRRWPPRPSTRWRRPTEGRATYLLTGLDGERRRLTAVEADALGERAARAVAHGRPALIGDSVLDPILPPLHLVVCGAGPDAAPLVAAGVRQGWRVDVVDPRRSWLRPERFPGTRLLDAEPAAAGEATSAGEWTAVVIMSHDYLRDAAFLRGFLGRGVTYLGILGPRDRTERLMAELPSPPSEADLAVLHAPAGLDLGADGAEQVATSIVSEILAVLHGRSGGHLRDRPGPIHG